jgi:hypothetical protein
VGNLDIEYILAKLKKERRRIEGAICALEKTRSAKSRKKEQRAAKTKKQRSGVQNRFDDRRQNREGES